MTSIDQLREQLKRDPVPEPIAERDWGGGDGHVHQSDSGETGPPVREANGLHWHHTGDGTAATDTAEDDFTHQHELVAGMTDRPYRPKAIVVIGPNWSPATIATLDDKRMCKFKFCFNVARFESDHDNTVACPEHANDECWVKDSTVFDAQIKDDAKTTDSVKVSVTNDNDPWVNIDFVCADHSGCGATATWKKGELALCSWHKDRYDEDEAAIAEAEEEKSKVMAL